jgi:hypothetical protein
VVKSLPGGLPVPDQLILEGGKAVLMTEEGRRLERTEAQLLCMLRKEFVAPWQAQAMPDGVKFTDWRPPFLVVVHQTPPHVRQLRWIAADSPEPFGEGVVYRNVRLSLPYTITFALYQQHAHGLFLTQLNELYFRNEPLRALSDCVGYPALLNLSRIQTPLREKAWICTQYLTYEPDKDWTGQLQALLEHTFNGGFNLSSENHEGASWFGLSRGVHRDLHPVERWEKASAKNDAFALGVTWKPVPQSVGDIIECLFLEANPAPGKPDLPARFLNFNPEG